MILRMNKVQRGFAEYLSLIGRAHHLQEGLIGKNNGVVLIDKDGVRAKFHEGAVPLPDGLLRGLCVLYFGLIPRHAQHGDHFAPVVADRREGVFVKARASRGWEPATYHALAAWCGRRVRSVPSGLASFPARTPTRHWSCQSYPRQQAERPRSGFSDVQVAALAVNDKERVRGSAQERCPAPAPVRRQGFLD